MLVNYQSKNVWSIPGMRAAVVPWVLYSMSKEETGILTVS